MKEIRLEVNLDVRDDVDIERLVQLVQWACNVWGVMRVQAVRVVKEKR